MKDKQRVYRWKRIVGTYLLATCSAVTVLLRTVCTVPRQGAHPCVRTWQRQCTSSGMRCGGDGVGVVVREMVKKLRKVREGKKEGSQEGIKM